MEPTFRVSPARACKSCVPGLEISFRARPTNLERQAHKDDVSLQIDAEGHAASAKMRALLKELNVPERVRCSLFLRSLHG